MMTKFHAGDVAKIDGRTVIIQCIDNCAARVDIDNGELRWPLSDLELVESNYREFKEVDEVIILEPNPIQKRTYPCVWNDYEGENGMDYWIGKTVTIQKIYHDRIMVNENGWRWNECNLKHVDKEEAFCLY